MPSKAQIYRWLRSGKKYKTRKVNFCFKCGRARGVLKDFDLCRICFRELAHKGQIPGIKKASW